MAQYVPHLEGRYNSYGQMQTLQEEPGSESSYGSKDNQIVKCTGQSNVKPKARSQNRHQLTEKNVTAHVKKNQPLNVIENFFQNSNKVPEVPIDRLSSTNENVESENDSSDDYQIHIDQRKTSRVKPQTDRNDNNENRSHNDQNKIVVMGQ